MNNMNFTDWQDLSLKKDVEKISKSINSSADFSISIIINLIIATLTLALTAISVVLEEESMLCWIIALAIISVATPLAIFLVRCIKKHRKAVYEIIKKKMPVKEYIDKFDNKICSNAMMADSLFEHMKIEQDITAKYYCICEINYYINKCIDELFAMKNMSSQIFVETKDNCVSPKRLRLVLKLLNKLRRETYQEMKNITEKKDASVEEYVNDEIKIHDDRIIHFIKEFNDINKSPILSKWAGCL